MEDWFERVGEIMDTLPSILSPETLLVSLLSYKGEEEGFTIVTCSNFK